MEFNLVFCLLVFSFIVFQIIIVTTLDGAFFFMIYNFYENIYGLYWPPYLMEYLYNNYNSVGKE